MHIHLLILLQLLFLSRSEWTWRKYVSGLSPDSITPSEVILPPSFTSRDRPYSINPLPGGGAVVYDLDLTIKHKGENEKGGLAEVLTEDLKEAGFMVIKGNKHISGERQIEISSWFGPINSKTTPNQSVRFLSNDAKVGQTGIGITGWHSDGYCNQYPFGHLFLHAVNVSKGGDTLIASIPRAIQRLSPGFIDYLKTLSYEFKEGASKGLKNPIMIRHYQTSVPTLHIYFGPNCLRGLVEDRGVDKVTYLAQEDMSVMNEFFANVLEQPEIFYRHKWEYGDFLIMDNWLVAHLAPPETQLPANQVGLRKIQRSITFTLKNLETYAKQKLK